MTRKRRRYRRVSALALAFGRFRRHRRGPVIQLRFRVGLRKVIRVRKKASSTSDVLATEISIHEIVNSAAIAKVVQANEDLALAVNQNLPKTSNKNNVQNTETENKVVQPDDAKTLNSDTSVAEALMAGSHIAEAEVADHNDMEFEPVTDHSVDTLPDSDNDSREDMNSHDVINTHDDINSHDAGNVSQTEKPAPKKATIWGKQIQSEYQQHRYGFEA